MVVKTTEAKIGTEDKRMNALSAKEFSRYIHEMYKNGFRGSIFGVGDIGVGKSEAPRKAAQAIAKEKGLTFYEYAQNKPLPEKPFVFVDLRLTDLEPVDLTGLPRDDPTDSNTVIFKTQRFVKFLGEHPGILFLDELTNENRPNMKASSYKILLDRVVGQMRLHPDTIVVAAGNRPDDAIGIAEGFSAPQANRLTIVNIRAPTVDEWIEYMNTNFVTEKEVEVSGKKEMRIVGDWDKRVAAFLKQSQSRLSERPQEAYTLENFGTPRAWTQFASISHKLSQDVLESFASGKVGQDSGMNFIQFTKIQVEPLDYYAKDPKRWSELKELDEPVSAEYLLAGQIADRLGDDASLDALIGYMADESGDTIGLVLAMMPDKNKVAFLKRIVKTDKKLLKFVQNISKYKLGTSDVDGSSMYSN